MRVPGLILNLGSGKDWNAEYLNADIQASKNPDWLVDISKVKWGDTLKTRFGQLEIVPGMFEAIVANDVLEHIPICIQILSIPVLAGPKIKNQTRHSHILACFL